jgi:hypothetical protein
MNSIRKCSVEGESRYMILCHVLARGITLVEIFLRKDKIKRCPEQSELAPESRCNSPPDWLRSDVVILAEEVFLYAWVTANDYGSL